jgi:hypothetical protein
MFGAALSLLLLDKELFAAAEELVDDVERQVEEQTGQRLEEVEGSIKIRQRRSIGFGVIAHTAFKRYPKRNPVRLRDLLGPLLLGHLFDTVGRRTMITLCYTLSGVLLIGTGLLFNAGTLSATTLTACWVVVFFFASAGASAAYLTGSEIFPMETRAMALAFFYAVGTGIGGVTGPALFAKLVETGKEVNVFYGYLLGAALMIAAGVAEWFIGVEAAGKSLEDVARPLTAHEEEGEGAQAPA